MSEETIEVVTIAHENMRRVRKVAAIDQLAQDVVLVMAYSGCDQIAERMLDRFLDKEFPDRHYIPFEVSDAAASLVNEQDVGFSFLQHFKATTPKERAYHDTVEALSTQMNKYLGVIP